MEVGIKPGRSDEGCKIFRAGLAALSPVPVWRADAGRVCKDPLPAISMGLPHFVHGLKVTSSRAASEPGIPEKQSLEGVLSSALLCSFTAGAGS